MKSGFATKRLQLAIFLHASGSLQFDHAEPTDDGKLLFVFSDPEHLGPQFELDFERGADVSAKDLFASQTYLRRQMTAALEENRKIGEPPNEAPAGR